MALDLKSFAIGKANGSGGGGDVEVKPLTVKANGVYDDLGNVAYKPVRVQVPTPTLEDVTITQNGTTEAIEGKAFKKVTVQVPTYPEPTGSINITENGTYNVKDKAEAVVDVQGGLAKGVIWTEVDNEGYPIKVELNGVTATSNIFRYGDYNRTKEIKLPPKLYNKGLGALYFICYGCENLEKININEVDLSELSKIDNSAFLGCKKLTLDNWQIPEGITEIGISAFENCEMLDNRIFPSTITTIADKAFNRCCSMNAVTFKGKPTSISSTSFANCTALIDIYVPWSEGEVANAPWGATNATITYNYTGE